MKNNVDGIIQRMKGKKRVSLRTVFQDRIIAHTPNTSESKAAPNPYARYIVNLPKLTASCLMSKKEDSEEIPLLLAVNASR